MTTEEAYKEVLQKFARPISTYRTPDGEDKPEDDIIGVRVKMRDWFKMKIVVGDLTAEDVRLIMPKVRPSEEFLKELEDFEKSVKCEN